MKMNIKEDTEFVKELKEINFFLEKIRDALESIDDKISD